MLIFLSFLSLFLYRIIHYTVYIISLLPVLPLLRLVCICFPTPGRGLPYGSGLGLSRCLGPGECLHSFIHYHYYSFYRIFLILLLIDIILYVHEYLDNAPGTCRRWPCPRFAPLPLPGWQPEALAGIGIILGILLCSSDLTPSLIWLWDEATPILQPDGECLVNLSTTIGTCRQGWMDTLLPARQ